MSGQIHHIASWRNYCIKVARGHTLPAWYDAEDMAQDALERLVRDIPRFDRSKGSFTQFIKFRIHASMIDRLRWLYRYKVNYTPYRPEFDIRMVDTASPAEAAMDTAKARQVLTKAQDRVINYVYWIGLSLRKYSTTHRTAINNMRQAIGG